jgi:peptide/nickel transport system substrate-binding protein
LTNSGRRASRLSLLALGTVIVLMLSSTAYGSTPRAASSSPRRGGNLNVLMLSAAWSEMDPIDPIPSLAAMDAVYGTLFDPGPNGTVIPDIASGYSFADHNMQLTITLHHGVNFSDGTPLNAAAVVFNLKRDLLPANACQCASNFAAVTSVAASGDYSVVLTLSKPYAPILSAFLGIGTDWMVSPTALNSMGATAFGQKPVGAGPFLVTSQVPGSSITMVRNPHYWVKGQPYLNSIAFTAIDSDQSAYEALESGQYQASIDGTTTIDVINQEKHTKGLKVLIPPSVNYEFVSLNETQAPFNNILAREALVYATNAPELVKSLYHNYYPVTYGPTATGQLFYQANIPGERKYDLAKAKKLVQQLGGLTVTLSTTENTTSWVTEAEALAGQWSEAGIQTTFQFNTIQQTIAQLEKGSWQTLLSHWGNYADPYLDFGEYFSSTGLFSGLRDSTLDNLIVKGTETYNAAARAKIYLEIDELMQKNADGVWLYSLPEFAIYSTKIMNFPQYGLEPDLDEVWLKK